MKPDIFPFSSEGGHTDAVRSAGPGVSLEDRAGESGLQK